VWPSREGDLEWPPQVLLADETIVKVKNNAADVDPA
jgi:hypothetical protein